MSQKKQDRMTVSESAYDMLRKAIMDNRFAPGQTLSERKLSETLGISRTPIREALLRLDQDGLLVRGPQSSFQIVRLKERDLREVFEVRACLEGISAKKAALHVKENAADRDLVIKLQSDLAAAQERIRSGDFSQEFELDLRLHDQLLQLAANRRIEMIIGQMQAQIHYVRIFTKYDPARSEETFVEHMDILQAVIDGDGDRAEQSMLTHIRRAEESACELLKKDREMDLAPINNTF